MDRQRAEQLLIAYAGGCRPGQYDDVETDAVPAFCSPVPETFPNDTLDAVASYGRAIYFPRHSHSEAWPAGLVGPGENAKEAIIGGLVIFENLFEISRF